MAILTKHILVEVSRKGHACLEAQSGELTIHARLGRASGTSVSPSSINAAVDISDCSFEHSSTATKEFQNTKSLIKKGFDLETTTIANSGFEGSDASRTDYGFAMKRFMLGNSKCGT